MASQSCCICRSAEARGSTAGEAASSDDGPIADQLRRALQEMHAAHDVPPSVSELLDRLVHKYEVSRRIYRYYDDGWRRNADARKVAPGAYLLLAQALVEYCRWRPAALQPLSTLLKLCDALTSLGGSAYTDDERAILASVLASERDFIIAMAGGAST